MTKATWGSDSAAGRRAQRGAGAGQEVGLPPQPRQRQQRRPVSGTALPARPPARPPGWLVAAQPLTGAGGELEERVEHCGDDAARQEHHDVDDGDGGVAPGGGVEEADGPGVRGQQARRTRRGVGTHQTLPQHLLHAGAPKAAALAAPRSSPGHKVDGADAGPEEDQACGRAGAREDARRWAPLGTARGQARPGSPCAWTSICCAAHAPAGHPAAHRWQQRPPCPTPPAGCRSPHPRPACPTGWWRCRTAQTRRL